MQARRGGESLQGWAQKQAWSRKKFLEVTGLAALATLVVRRANASQTSPKPKRRRRYGMVIDLKRCIACRACTVACKQENKTPPRIFYTNVSEEEVGQYPNVRRINIPAPCFHCENPPCVPVCPIEATWKRQEDGIVVVDYEKCQGLGYCVDACPYGKRFIDDGQNYHEEPNEFDRTPSPEYKENRVRRPNEAPISKVRKCTFCLHRQDDNGNYISMPACAQTCMAKAIHFGDLNDRESEVSQLLRTRKWMRLKEEAGTEPNVYYLS